MFQFQVKEGAIGLKKEERRRNEEETRAKKKWMLQITMLRRRASYCTSTGPPTGALEEYDY